MHWIKAKLLLLSIAFVWAGSAFLHVKLPFADYNFYVGYIYIAATLMQLTRIEALKRYGYSWWISTDQMVNVLHGGNPDITVASKIGYMAVQGSKTALAMEYVVNFLFYISVGQKDHCKASIEHDEKHY